MTDGVGYRYRYHNKLYHATGAAHGTRCNPVTRDDGKCVVGGGKQLVIFEDGVMATVVRRCLKRLVKP